MSITRNAATQSPDAVAGALADHLRAHGGRYLETKGEVGVRLRRALRRSNATLYHFDLKVGDLVRGVVVKVAQGRRQHDPGGMGAALPDRLRQFPATSSPLERHRLEAATLARIEQHFSKQGDPRFGTIRLLDEIPELLAIVMEESADVGLDERLRGARRLHSGDGARGLDAAFQNAGAWLREYHGLHPLPATATRDAQRSDFHASVERHADYLTGAAARSRFDPRLRDAIHRAAEAALPRELPLAVIHADFVPRNVLVAPDRRVTVFDTRARWRAPAFEDLARLLVALRASRSQAWSRGVLYDGRMLDGFERALLAGYYDGAPIPLQAIRLFEVQRLLGLWVGAVHQLEAAAGRRRLPKRASLELWAGFFRRRIATLLGEAPGRG
jgi:aminoglycoside phosphotransferase (APT) family kinase protein